MLFTCRSMECPRPTVPRGHQWQVLPLWPGMQVWQHNLTRSVLWPRCVSEQDPAIVHCRLCCSSPDSEFSKALLPSTSIEDRNARSPGNHLSLLSEHISERVWYFPSLDTTFFPLTLQAAPGVSARA